MVQENRAELNPCDRAFYFDGLFSIEIILWVATAGANGPTVRLSESPTNHIVVMTQVISIILPSEYKPVHPEPIVLYYVRIQAHIRLRPTY